MSEHDSADPASPFLLERLMREAFRRQKNSEAESAEEFLAEAEQDELAAGRRETLDDDPVEMAQELAYQAYESTDADRARGLVTRALDLDPGCVDALTVQAFLESEDAGTLIEALERAAEVGEDQLGEEFFAEHMGGFWALVQARPYMRAVKQLAEVLWHVGRRFDAVARYESLIELDPEDNMGNASLLLGYYLAMGEVQRAWDLLEEFDDRENTVCAWAWLLLHLQTGDEEAALDALKHALELNPHVAPYLVGLADLPEDEVPAYFTAGSVEEAAYTMQIIGEAFERTVDAPLWLYNVLLDLGVIEVDEDGDDPTAH